MGVKETAASPPPSDSAPAFIDNLMTLNFWRAAAAELLGSFFLTLIICGASIDWSVSSRDADDVIHAALASGLSLATVHFAMRHVSGGHLNPAVTVAMATTRHTSIVRALIYIIVQCAGASLGALTVAALTPRDTRGLLGATTLTEGLLASQGLGVECVISFVLVLTFFKTNDFDERSSSFAGCSSISLGLAAVACNLFALGYTGASMNCARSFGPALVLGLWQDHWVYWCGPILGAIAAGFTYECILSPDCATSISSNKRPLAAALPSHIPSSLPPPASVPAAKPHLRVRISEDAIAKRDDKPKLPKLKLSKQCDKLTLVTNEIGPAEHEAPPVLVDISDTMTTPTPSSKSGTAAGGRRLSFLPSQEPGSPTSNKSAMNYSSLTLTPSMGVSVASGMDFAPSSYPSGIGALESPTTPTGAFLGSRGGFMGSRFTVTRTDSYEDDLHRHLSVGTSAVNIACNETDDEGEDEEKEE